MKSHLFLLLMAALAMMAAVSSCDVHEFPAVQEPEPPAVEEPTRVFRLTLRHETSLPTLGEYDYESGSVIPTRTIGPEEEAKPHWIRYTINAYAQSRSESRRESDSTYVFTRPVADGLDTTLEFDIPKGDYNLIVWTDYVDDGSTADKYYKTSDFAELILMDRSNHYGSNDYRDAFYGRVETTVSRTDADGTISTIDIGEATVDLVRPMAKFTFVSTDLQRFLENESRQRSSAPAESPVLKAPALEDYRVRFVYTRYMPCSFNLFTGKPADSWTGVEYYSVIKQLSSEEAQIGFDYVFVNGDTTGATVGIEVLDSDDNMLARIPAFDVPLLRSHHTIVKGEFLTTKTGGSLGINPDFNGSFNIEII